MIIDFHTHMFPDKIAAGTIAHLASIIEQVHPYTDGTYEGLKRVTEESGVDISIALPIVTTPKQFESINRFAANYQEGNVISFGSIHPDSDDYKSQLRFIKELGLKGIKFHPDYQETYFNDIRYKRIISYASELGLVIVTHAGMDPLSPDKVHCTVPMIREVIDEVQPEKLVLAHMGGHMRWDEVEDLIVGKNVYFDTGVVLDKMDLDQCVRMMKNHGTDKILFGTDMPWSGQKEYIEIIRSLDLTDEDKERIFYKNACKLLGI